MLKNKNNIITYNNLNNHFYLKYFLYKYIYIFYKKYSINKIYLSSVQNTVVIYIFINNLTKTYNIKQSFYFIKSLNYFLKIPVKLYLINLNYKFIEKVLKKEQENKKIFKEIIINYNKITKNKLKSFKLFFLVFIFSLFFKNFKLLLVLIVDMLKKINKHFQFLKILKFFFTYYFLLNKNLKGIKLQIKGRLNGSLRAKKYSFILGTLTTQTFTKKIYYNQTQIKTNYGICGIKLWIALN